VRYLGCSTRYNAKLVVISDIAGFFLDDDVPEEEAQRVYSQIMRYISNFARKHQIAVIATYLPYGNGRRNSALQEMTFAKAATVVSFIKTKYRREVFGEASVFCFRHSRGAI
jgi:hypothetical protein